jgi:hypothetical protein
MDTTEARIQMRDLAHEGLAIIDRLAQGQTISGSDRERLRGLLVDARALLADAGYPGESVWRGLQRAALGVETHFDRSVPAYWADVAGELRAGMATLDSLVAPAWRSEPDLHIIG